MTPLRHFRRLTDGTSGRIVELLRGGPKTIDDLAAALDLTRTAIRAQLTSMLADGSVEHRGFRRGASKPARLYAVTSDAELQLSRAYIPVLVQLLKSLTNRMNPREIEDLLREVGQNLAGGVTEGGTFDDRIAAAQQALQDLGGLAEVTRVGGQVTILGHGCPLAAATAEFPQACRIVEHLLSALVGRPVKQCCERYGRTRCCFEVSTGAA